MRRRRRYEVVVEGLSGQAAAQRSVVSEHRSEEAAREDARAERARLEVIYGEAAVDWRVIVIRDDEILWEERPAGLAGPRLMPVTPVEPPRTEEPEPEPVAAEGTPGEAAPGETGTGTETETLAPQAEAEPEPEPDPEPDRSGPVPAWLIEQFEQSIARTEQRERERNRKD